jgi:large subunit ribosomal protein L6
MSRIGRMPITVPAGVDVKIDNENTVTVKGPLGTLTEKFSKMMEIKFEGGVITVCRPNDEKENRAIHGLTRTLIANMVEGVTKGYSKKLEIVGVGYKVAKEGKKLNLSLGYSHPIYVEEVADVTFEVPGPNEIIVKGISKQNVGQIAAEIRGKRPPEPYHGKGVKYEGEHIRHKAGKAGK